MLKTPNLKESEKEYYTINNFRNELKSLDENKNSLNNENTKFSKIKSSNIKNNKYNSLRKNTNFETINEEILKNEIINMKTENEELKFCLNSIIKLLNKKLFKILSNNNINNEKNKNKELENQNILIKSLNEELKNLELILSKSNERNPNSLKNSNKNEKQNDKLTKIKEKNKLNDIKNNKYKNELESKNEKELFKKIEELKNKLSNQQQTLNLLNKELIEKNQIINQIKSKQNFNEIINRSENNNSKIEIEKYTKELNFEDSNNQKIEENQKNNSIKGVNISNKNIQTKYENQMNSEINNYEIDGNSKQMNNNIILREENNNLKNINKELNSKYKEMSNLKVKYDELLININELKKENAILKNKLNQSYISTSRNINNSKNKIINNFNYDNEIPNNNQIINNTTISDNNDFKTTPMLYDNIYKKNFAFDKMRRIQKLNNSEKKQNNISLNDDKTNKRPSLSSLIISDTTRGKRKDNNTNINNQNFEENINNKNQYEIEQSFNLYKPLKEGLLVFNILKKMYYMTIPEKYFEFWEEFESEGSLQYNTLEGLFLINPKDNQLYYYSSKKNIICDLLTFKENHSYGCLFVDNLSKNIIAIGGKFSKSVELFSFESEKIEDLPELSTYRSKMTCCQINNKIYCLFGINEKNLNDSKIEYLDLDDLNNGWIEINYINNTSFIILTCMSCVNLNNVEMLIIGGMKNDNIANEKLIYYNIESKELYELDKDLPESDNKIYLFTKNNMFNLFLNGNTISFINIDDNKQIHIIDNELKYDLYLAPNI